MGAGEEAYDRFYQWFSALTAEAQADFERRFPEPEGWEGLYRTISASPWRLDENG